MRTALALIALLSLVGLAAQPSEATDRTPTATTVVRPVTADGAAGPGWRVHRVRDAVATCDDASAAAVDDGIATCYPSALYLPSCWRSAHHTVLCVRDVDSRRLVRVRYRGDYPDAAAPATPSPQALTLAAGGTCTVRVGGAWGTVPGHPRWLGFYSCSHGSVYGPPHGDGIDRSRATWRVHLVRPDGRVVTRSVRDATVVGTAA